MPRFEKHSKLAPRGATGIIRFFFEIEALKNLLRTGWVNHGMPQDKVESVADHSWSVALLADALAAEYAPHLDRSKIMRMAMIHELGEIYGNDMTPHDNVSKEEKYRIERESVMNVLAGFGNTEWGGHLQLWEEHEKGETPEAKWVNQVDKLEMSFQAQAYQTRGLAKLEEFFPYVEKRLEDPALKKIFSKLLALAQKDSGL